MWSWRNLLLKNVTIDLGLKKSVSSCIHLHAYLTWPFLRTFWFLHLAAGFPRQVFGWRLCIFFFFLYFCFAFFCIFTWVHVSPCPQVFGWRQGNVQSQPGRTCHVSTTWSKTWSINVLQQKKYFSFTFHNNFCLFCLSWKTRNWVNHLRQPYPPILQFDILGKDFI